MPIDARPDHVAAAVPSIERAATRWVDELGGGWIAPVWEAPSAGFAARQLRFRGGGKLELLEPRDRQGFAAGFLTRRGAGIHHVTLKVPELLPAVDALRAAGLDVVDVSTEREEWHEAFLRPSQVGGLIVQVARAAHSEAEWSASLGITPQAPRPDGGELLGPRLSHPDLDRATWLWSLLGAEVAPVADGVIVARWPGAALEVEVVAGDRAEPLGLRFRGGPELPADPSHGPATLPVS